MKKYYMKVFLIIPALLILSGVCHAKWFGSDEGPQYLELGVVSYASSDFKKAVGEFTAAIKQKATFEGYFLRGKSYFYQKDYARAEDDFKSALKIKKAACSYFARAQVYAELKKYDQAIKDMDAAAESLEKETALAVKASGVKTSPEDTKRLSAYYYWYRAVISASMNLPDSTVANSSKAIDLLSSAGGIENYDTAFDLYRKFKAYLSKEKADSYLIILKIASVQTPFEEQSGGSIQDALADVYSLRGTAYLGLKSDKALPDLSSAITLSPGNASYYKGRATAYVQLKDADSAYADFKKALDLKADKNSSGMFILSRAIAASFADKSVQYNNNDNYTKALETIVRAIELEPTPDRYISAAWWALLTGGFADTLKYANASLLLDPGQYGINTYIGHAYLLEGKKAAALTVYRRFMDKYGDNPGAVLKGEFSLLKKRYPDKTSLIEEAAKELALIN